MLSQTTTDVVPFGTTTLCGLSLASITIKQENAR